MRQHCSSNSGERLDLSLGISNFLLKFEWPPVFLWGIRTMNFFVVVGMLVPLQHIIGAASKLIIVGVSLVHDQSANRCDLRR